MPALLRTFLAFILSSAALTGHADTYRVIDLTPAYWRFESQAQGLDDAAQFELFKRIVVAPHPEAYAAEVIGLPTEKPYDEELHRRFTRVRALLADKEPLMRRISASIASDLPRYEKKFRETFPDLAYTGDIYFMHSLGGFDGGTRQIGGRTVLLFGVDMIAYVYGTDADPQPFFHHELFHIYHAQFPGAGTETDDDDTIAGGLWREGLATYVAQALNPQAGGVAIFGLPRTMPEQAQAMLPELARGIRAVLSSKARDDYARYFLGGHREKNASGIPERSGYYVGFLVARKIAARHVSLPELARIPVVKLRPEIEAALDEIAAGH